MIYSYRFRHESIGFRLLLLFFSCFILTIQVQGQQLDRTYYLLGTLGDYLGREYPKNNPFKFGYIIRLHESRILEIQRIEEVTRMRFKKLSKRNNHLNRDQFYELASIFKVGKINSFYDLEKKRGMTDRLGFTFYSGELLGSKLEGIDREKQISFLLGQFLTSGDVEDSIFKYKFYNSVARYEITSMLLKELNFEIIKQEFTEGVPSEHLIEFLPPPDLKELFMREFHAKQKHFSND